MEIRINLIKVEIPIVNNGHQYRYLVVCIDWIKYLFLCKLINY